MTSPDETPLMAAGIAMLAEGIAILLFLGMIAVWSAIGAGA
jgi:hypothetical protein